MDAFYASVEQRDFPELRGKPIAVGGNGQRGVTTTASYEARKYGVRSAMPGYKAKQLCPDLIFVPPRFEVYQATSRQIRAIFEEYTDLIEPLSLDEAFLDVTENKKNILLATDLAKEIMRRIKKETQLTCSAGVSYCKFLAKIASDINKPYGIKVIQPHQAETFIEQLPIKKFFGVGKVTAAKMESMGIFNGGDLKKLSKIELSKRFGKSGRFYYNIVRGIDNRPVNNNRIRKSLGIERTFKEDLAYYEDILPILDDLIIKFHQRLTRAENFGRTITLKLKTHEFKTLTRSMSKEYFITEEREIHQIAHELLQENIDSFKKIRLIGLSASNLQTTQPTSLKGQLKLKFPR